MEYSGFFNCAISLIFPLSWTAIKVTDKKSTKGFLSTPVHLAHMHRVASIWMWLHWKRVMSGYRILHWDFMHSMTLNTGIYFYIPVVVLTISYLSFFSAYNEKVVAFLRQPNVIDALKEKHATITSNQSLKNKINLIRSEGVETLDRLSSDVELIILLR